MDIDKLRSFMEVYNCKSMSRASELLFVSQSALSRRIQTLEEELKIQLFIRNGPHLEPTLGATALYKEADKLIRQHDSALMNINKFRQGKGGTLRIGILPLMKVGPCVRAVTQMQKAHPDAELVFDCDENTKIPQRFYEGELDVGITSFGEIQGFNNIAYEILSQNTFAVLIGKNHKLWKKRPFRMEDLNGERIYTYDRTSSQQSWTSVELYLKSMGIHFSERVQCRSLTEQLLYVATGAGLAPASLIANELFFSVPDQIEVVPVEPTNLEQGYHVAVYDPENALAKEFMDILKQVW